MDTKMTMTNLLDIMWRELEIHVAGVNDEHIIAQSLVFVKVNVHHSSVN